MRAVYWFTSLVNFHYTYFLIILNHTSSDIQFGFSALTLLVGRQEEHLACKKSSDRGAGMVIVERGANNLHMVQLMPLPIHFDT